MTNWLNFHHLRYFHAVARDGSIARAAKRLHTSPPSISVQLQKLEEHLGQPLFVKQGRGLVLTQVGQLVRDYAEEIFGLGTELVETVQGGGVRAARVRIGIADSVPKELAARFVQPLFDAEEPTRVIVREGDGERLLADLALHSLELVLLDEPPAAISRLKVFQHQLGDAQIGVFSARDGDRKLRRKFPESLRGAPFVLPLEDNLLRREFERWRSQNGLAIEVAAEVEDSALAKTMAREGRGLFLAPVVLSAPLGEHYGLRLIGELGDLHIPYVACTVARRTESRGIANVLEAARSLLAS